MADLDDAVIREAASATFATSLGLDFRASIDPERIPEAVTRRYNVPAPRNVDCAADSVWFRGVVRLSVAGDVALRHLDPDRPLFDGRRNPDVRTAVKLLEAVLERDDVPTQLETHVDRVGEFFESELIWERLAIVARLLVDHTEIDAVEIRRIAMGGRCGAIDPLTGSQCIESSPRHRHACETHLRLITVDDAHPGAPAWFNVFELDHVQRRRPTPLKRKLVSIIDRSGAPRNPRPIDSFEVLNRRLTDPATPSRVRGSALRQLARLIDERSTNSVTSLSTPAREHAEESLRAHASACGGEVIKTDVDRFCGRCAFHLVREGAEVPRYLFVVGPTEVLNVVDRTEPVESFIPWAVLDSANAAAGFLRMAPLASDRPTWAVKRFPDPRPKPRKSKSSAPLAVNPK